MLPAAPGFAGAEEKYGGYFGSGESTGSIGVVTINMPRIAYLSKDKEDFYRRLDKMMDLAARSLKIKRTIVTKLLNEGLYPYTKRYLGTFENHFSTIGLVGMNEVGLNAKWLRKDLTHKETQDFTREVLIHMRDKLADYQVQYGDLYNLEATPAESTAYRLAKHDKERYPDIITASQGETPYYTNSSHLPVSFTDDIFAALDIQDELQTIYTSGTVFHAFVGERMPDWRSAAALVRKIAENYTLPYYTISPTYSVCREHGYLRGEQWACPHCGAKTEVYSRITGYYRPVQNWNDGKVQEYKERKVYRISIGTLHEAPKQPVLEKPKRVMLFTTKFCPNCTIAVDMLNRAGISFIKVDAGQQPELAAKYDVMQAPTLVVVEEKRQPISAAQARSASLLIRKPKRGRLLNRKKPLPCDKPKRCIADAPFILGGCSRLVIYIIYYN